MSESFNGVDPGMKGRENTRFPIGTMTVDAMNNTLAEPNLLAKIGEIHKKTTFHPMHPSQARASMQTLK